MSNPLRHHLRAHLRKLQTKGARASCPHGGTSGRPFRQAQGPELAEGDAHAPFKKNFRRCAHHLLWGCLFLPVFLHAAGPDANQVPPPQPPFVAAPPKGVSWELRAQRATTPATAESPKGAGGAAPTANRVEAIRYKLGSQITYVSLAFTNGLRVDHYIKGGMDYTLYLATKQASARIYSEPDMLAGAESLEAKQTSAKIYSEPSDADPFICKGFPAVEWLSAAAYVGSETIGNAKCYHFHLAATVPGPGQPPESRIPELDAWIALENKLPVQIKIDGAVFTFSPLKPLDQDIEIPVDLQAAVQRAETEVHALELMMKANSKGDR